MARGRRGGWAGEGGRLENSVAPGCGRGGDGGVPRIVRIEPFVVSQRLQKPFSYSQWEYDRRTICLVRVTADDGTYGWGEGYGPATVIKAGIEFLAPVLLMARDPKTAFQEWAHVRFHATPTYRTARDSGVEDDDERFTVEVRIGQETWGSGTGRSKRVAERHAAEEALLRSAGLDG